MNNQVDYDYSFKLIFIGRTQVGKSCLLQKMTQNKFNPEYFPTIGVDFRIKNVQVNEKKIRLLFWDSGGQMRFRNLVVAYVSNTKGIFYVFDLTKRATFDQIRYWRQLIEERLSSNTVTFLVGNKSDLEAERQISYEEGFAYATQNNMQYVEISAKEGTQIEESLQKMILKILQNLSAEQQESMSKKSSSLRPKRMIYTTCF